MKSTVVFYHAGCPVCLDAERSLATALDPQRYEIETVHLGQAKDRLDEAAKSGVVSVPALVLDGRAYHINFGAPLSALG